MIETLDKTQPLTERIAAAVARTPRPNGHPDAVRAFRARAADAFARLGIPGRKNEAWKYTNVERALRHGYALDATRSGGAVDAADFAIPGFDAHTLVVVNGEVQNLPADLPAGVRITSLRDALASNEAAAEHFGRYADVEHELFAALNTALDADGVFLQVARGVTLERPIQIVHVTDAAEDAFLQRRNLYLFGENSEALVVETYHSAGQARTFANSVSEIVVERAARVDVLTLQAESEAASQVTTTQVAQAEASIFRGHTYTLGGALVRNNVNAVPAGEHAETHLYGLYIAGGEQHVDNHTLIDHAAPSCFSNELYRGIIDDRATGVFNGKVFVRRDSQQTNAYQSSQGVVLSDDARHFSKPELEIYADDVKCSHGSTTGELEPEHVFYLRSRGLSERQAKGLLLYAFAHDIVVELPAQTLRDYLDGLIEQRLDG